jgi:hypothetical protein
VFLEPAQRRLLARSGAASVIRRGSSSADAKLGPRADRSGVGAFPAPQIELAAI